MTNLELFINAINSMEGLSVQLKIGKESELIIKGDFLTITKVFGKIIESNANDRDARREIERLENKIVK